MAIPAEEAGIASGKKFLKIVNDVFGGGDYAVNDDAVHVVVVVVNVVATALIPCNGYSSIHKSNDSSTDQIKS